MYTWPFYVKTMFCENLMTYFISLVLLLSLTAYQFAGEGQDASKGLTKSTTTIVLRFLASQKADLPKKAALPRSAPRDIPRKSSQIIDRDQKKLKKSKPSQSVERVEDGAIFYFEL